MDLIALTGPQCSGKSTLAEELEKHGYLRVEFADLLKRVAADGICFMGGYVEVEEIRKEKAKFRPFLQELGVVLGFNDDPYWVYEAIRQSGWSPGMQAVFDNVRTEEQFLALQTLGFQLVRLEAHEKVRFGRAREKYGIALTDFREQGRHPIELGIDLGQHVMVALDATQPAEVLAQTLIDLRVQEAA